MATKVHTIKVLESQAIPIGTITKRISNPYGKGCVLHVNVTTNGGGTLNVKIQSVDPISGLAVDIAGAAIAAIVAANGYFALYLFPGVLGVANVKVDGCLPANFNVVIVGSVAQITAANVALDILP